MNPYALQDSIAADEEAQEEAFIAFCDANDLDYDSPAAATAYDAYLAVFNDY